MPAPSGVSHRSDGVEGFLTRYGGVAALGVVGLAFLLRASGLSGWWLNPDEGIYYAVVTQERFAAFWIEATATAHPPLYFLILRAISWVTIDFVWLRSIALVSGCAAVYVFILVGRELTDDGARGWLTGLTAGLLLAVSPSAIELSQVIRPYMLLVLLLASALYFLLRYLKRPSKGALVAYASSASLAVLLHYSAVFGLGVIGILVVVDGLSRGLARPDWHRLLAIQSVPALILAVLYFWHLRDLMSSTVAQFALEGWLASYMIDSPGDVWLALVGVHSMLVGDSLAVAATLLSLIALVWAVWLRAWTPLVLLGAGFVIATAGAVMRVYPMGGSRHAAWLLAFATPGLAWVVGLTLTSWRRALSLALPVVGAVAVSVGPLSSTLGAGPMPRVVSEHVLREEHLVAMAEILDPQTEPRVVVMSQETYRLLVPLFALERQSAEDSPDGLFLHFRWGARDVIVLPGLDFSVRADEVDRPNHLYTATRGAAAGFGVSLPGPGEPVLVLSGGWNVQGIFDLAELSSQMSFPGTTTSVPGLIALSLDLEAYGRALAEPTG